MKKYNMIRILFLCIGIFSLASCRDDLLDQQDRNNMTDAQFWKTIDDAEYALNGAVADIRYLFDRDYFLDGMGEFVDVNGSSNSSSNLRGGAAYVGFYELYPSGYGYSFTEMYRYCYGGVNRCNYVIDGLEKMLEQETKADDTKRLTQLLAETRLFRALVYLRLVSMWGDVPYIDQRIYDKKEVETISRTPLEEVIKYMLDDLDFAAQELPDKAAQLGRMSKPAALALRGKVQLYWASWNHFGWPELETFTPSEEKAQIAYKAAAKDFRRVIDDFGLALFRNGTPGECDTLGRADKLPNYFYLFLPTANGDNEFILSFTHGGTGTGQSDELMRNLAGRSIEFSQCWVSPRTAITDRYQSTITGDFCDSIQFITPDKGGRTAPNSALNPKTYENRDYRMKASILWDYEMIMGLSAREETGWTPFIYKTWAKPNFEIDGQKYTTYETDRCRTGYVFRKFIRNYPGQERSEGDFNWPVIRLADVFLMYAEAVNMGKIDEEKNYAIEQVNKVRRRGNLPDLNSQKTATQEDFFDVIEQERIVELFAEGHRVFDLRRWRRIEKTFVQPFDQDGYAMRDTWGNLTTGYSSNGVIFKYANKLQYERCYIFQIPESERTKNSNLSQNKPFL